MKKLLALTLLLAATAASAQDMIVKRTADEIEAKVLEVSSDQIKYKRHSNPDGPTYSIATKEVFMIKYENGEKDVFEIEIAKPVRPTPTEPTTVSALTGGEIARPPIPKELLGSPWAGKFKGGIRMGYGMASLLTQGKGQLFFDYGGAAYGEYHTKSKAGWIVGFALGYRGLLHGESQGNYRVTTNIGILTYDLYTGMGNSNVRYSEATNSYSRKHTALCNRFGVRLRMPLTATSKSNMSGSTKQDFIKGLNPVQVGVFGDLIYYMGGFGIGLEFEGVFVNLYKKSNSLMYRFGMLMEYKF